jgi:protein involved in plasmid replication-relaxation
MRRPNTSRPQRPAVPLDGPVAWSSNPRSRRPDTPRGSSGDGNSLTSKEVQPARRGRIGAGQLRLRIESLSARDLAVLRSVRDHRFLGTRHVEALHFRGHATALSAARLARRLLLRLYKQNLLDHLDRRIGGIRAGSAGYIWTLSSAGARLLAEVDGASSIRRQHEPSLRLLNHYLAVAEVHVELIDADDAGRFDVIDVQVEPGSWRRFHGLGGEVRLVRPDMAVVTASGDYEDHWFLEVDLGSEHPPTVVKKCHLYLDYLDSGTEQGRLGVFPRVLWVVPDETRLDRLQRALTEDHLDPDLFRIATMASLSETLAGGAS